MADDQGSPSDRDLLLSPTTVVRSPRRRALWGALAVVAVAAGALAVNAGGGGPGAAPVLPVALGAVGRAEGAGAADASMAWGAVTYVAGDALPRLGGEAPAYRFAGAVDEARVRALATTLGLSGDPTHQDRSWHLESGDSVLEVYEDAGGIWWFSRHVVSTVEPDGGGSSGCDPDGTSCAGVATGVATVDPATTVPAPECADGASCSSAPTTADAPTCPPESYCQEPGTNPCPPDAECSVPPPIVPPPIEPPPAADLPSEGEARQIALDLLTATGTVVEGAKVTVDGPYDAWYVNVEMVLDGVPVSGGVSSVTVGPKGLVMGASGTFGVAEQVGDYPLIDTRAAIDRLNEQQSYLIDSAPPLGAPGTASSGGGVATASGSASESVSSCAADSATGTTRCDDVVVGDAPPPVECLQPVPTDPASPTSTDCGPDVCVYSEGPVTTVAVPACDPGPAPEPVTITLTGAERVLVLMPASDGSSDAYLVPGYRFSNDDGAMAEIAAVADDSLAPTTTVPSTVEPPSPSVTDCPTVVDDGSGTDQPGPACAPPTEPVTLEIGVGYYVDVDVECAAFTLGDQVWRHDVGGLAGWSLPHEGGTFTLDAPDHGTFVGDASGTKTATFVTGTDPEGCQPASRR